MADIISSIGVSFILLAFFLLTIKKVKSTDLNYNLLNFFGGGLAAMGAVLLNSIPFIILESCWAIVALYAIVKRNKV